MGRSTEDDFLDFFDPSKIKFPISSYQLSVPISYQFLSVPKSSSPVRDYGQFGRVCI